jgi:hypothetical protein
MDSITITAGKSCAPSADAKSVSLILDTKWSGDLSLMIPSEALDNLVAMLNEAKTAVQSKLSPGQVTARMPKKWMVTADVQKHGVVLLIFDPQMPSQAGYALNGEAAKELATGLAKNAEAILAHKAATAPTKPPTKPPPA